MAAVKEVHMKMNAEKAKEIKEEIEKLEEDIEEADRRAEEAEKVEDAMYEDFQKDLKKQLDAKLQEAKGSALQGVGMDDLQQRLYQTHMDESSTMIKERQQDVMRTNKVIREVSRGISTEWQGVFEYLMAAQLSKAEIKEQIGRIEKQNRPLMQAYKALNVWKDTKSEELGLTQLADALRMNKKLELADYVLDALECEGDDYLKLKAPSDAPAASAEGGEKDKEDGEAKEGEKKRPKPTLKKSASRAGILDDSKFLQLAKKVGSEWEKLANTLGLDEEDVKEILENEGATYQGGFKMLWTWRDRTLEMDQDNAQVLREALTACGKPDIAELV